MHEPGDPSAVRVYPHRVWAAILAALCLPFAVLAAVVAFGEFQWPPLWFYQEPVRSILGVGFLILLVGAMAILLYLVVTPEPLFTFDREGMTYRLSPFRHGALAWSDIEDISAFRQELGYGNRYLWFYIIVEDEAIAMYRYKGKPTIRLGIQEGILSVGATDVVREMRRFHEVRVYGKQWGALSVGDEE